MVTQKNIMTIDEAKFISNKYSLKLKFDEKILFFLRNNKMINLCTFNNKKFYRPSEVDPLVADFSKAKKFKLETFPIKFNQLVKKNDLISDLKIFN